MNLDDVLISPYVVRGGPFWRRRYSLRESVHLGHQQLAAGLGVSRHWTKRGANRAWDLRVAILIEDGLHS